MGHLNDHFSPSYPVLLHWLFPTKDLRTGLRALENLMASNSIATDLNDDGDCTDVDTDEDGDSYDETSEGELVRKNREFPKYDGNAAVPTTSTKQLQGQTSDV
jgi:hypothetical protein